MPLVKFLNPIWLRNGERTKCEWKFNIQTNIVLQFFSVCILFFSCKNQLTWLQNLVLLLLVHSWSSQSSVNSDICFSTTRMLTSKNGQLKTHTAHNDQITELQTLSVESSHRLKVIKARWRHYIYLSSALNSDS